MEDGTGNVLWMLADPLGTVHDLVERDAGNGATNIANHLTYNSFGNITAQTNSSRPIRYGFTGREWDSEVELWWYRARWYDPVVGRFVSEDSYGLGIDKSLYRYVQNNPTFYLDPGGHVPPLVGAAGAAITAFLAAALKAALIGCVAGAGIGGVGQIISDLRGGRPISPGRATCSALGGCVGGACAGGSGYATYRFLLWAAPDPLVRRALAHLPIAVAAAALLTICRELMEDTCRACAGWVGANPNLCWLC